MKSTSTKEAFRNKSSGIVAMLTSVIAVLCFATDAKAGFTWTGPSSVTVGDTFTVVAKYSGNTLNYTVSGSCVTWVSIHTYRATSPGTATFSTYYDMGGTRYTSSKTVSVRAAPQPTPTLSSVSISLSSSSIKPDDSVTCSMTAYLSTGSTASGGIQSWNISSITNDSISTSGIVTVAPA